MNAAGRTDAGVHAAAQEVAFDAPSRWKPAELRRALNANLPEDVWIEKARVARADFHPRFDATGRRYEYLIADGHDARSPLRRGRAWVPRRPPDEGVLRAMTPLLLGERSFESFARSGQPERGTRCRVERAEWWRTPGSDLVFLIVADRFLRHMVRYVVGTLVEVASGQRDEQEIGALLHGSAGVRPPWPAPPYGLYLTGVRYPDGWNRPAGIPGVCGEVSAQHEHGSVSPLRRSLAHG